MSYVGFDGELLQIIEAWKALEMPVLLVLSTVRSSRSKAEKKRCWQQRVTL